jgi:uncharacterized OB-fold protein
LKPSLQRVDEQSGRYLPVIYPEEIPYWQGLRERKIMLQRCSDCAKVWYPIGPVCPKCLSGNFEWKQMSGRGVVHNFVIYYKAWMPFLMKRVPYAVVQVQLEEGPRLTTNLIDVPLDEVKIGMPVEAAYEDVTDEITLLQFARPGKSL